MTLIVLDYFVIHLLKNVREVVSLYFQNINVGHKNIGQHFIGKAFCYI